MKGLWRKFLNLVGIEEYEENYSETDYESPKVVDLNSRNQTEIMIVNVESFEDAKKITAFLRQRKGILLNLKNVIKDEAKRIIDFVCGTTFALNGNMQKIADDIFLFTPYNITIVEEKKQQENLLDAREA
ncbi:MAG: cell division protein SepF [Candidatus Muirbacterium halophilum]|nr:cell division protein SepF [Candidatus Muirbacterium halophilum]MCK9475367.1 cell division protein SepF [Candidatus Muirbacterium halophilum]